MKYIVFFLLALFTNLVYAFGNQAGFVVITSDGTGHIYFPSSQQSLTQSIFIQWLDAHDQVRCCLKLNRKALKKIDTNAATNAQSIIIINWRTNDIQDIVAYKITSKLPRPTNDFIGIAIAANEVTVDSSPYRLLARTNGKQLSARICFGEEGENLIAQEDKEYQILYMGFGYSIDEKPKCNERDKRILETVSPN